MPPLANDQEYHPSPTQRQGHEPMTNHASVGNQTPALATSSSSAPRTTSSTATSAPVSVGERCTLVPGTTLLDMVDSTDLYSRGDVAGWKARLDQDGYILLRSVLPLTHVIHARESVSSVLSNEWHKIDLNTDPSVLPVTDQSTAHELLNSTPLLRARIASDSTTKRMTPGVLLTGFRAVTHDPRMLRLIEGPEVAFLMEQLYGHTQLERERQRQAKKLSPSASTNPPSSTVSNSVLPLHPPAPSSLASTSTDSASSIATSSSASSFPSSSSTDLSSQPFLASASTFDTKWVRVHGQGEFTDEHSDYYRFEHSCSNGSSNNNHDNSNDLSTSEENNPPDNGAADMFTVWIPLGDYPLHHGTLVVAEGTHRLDGYRAGVYEQESKSELPPDFENWQRNGNNRDADSSSTDSSNHTGGVWRSTHFHPGDLVLFDLRLVHASTKNQTNHFRMSVDTRWKPTSRLTDEEGDTFKPVASGRKLGFSDSQR